MGICGNSLFCVIKKALDCLRQKFEEYMYSLYELGTF